MKYRPKKNVTSEKNQSMIYEERTSITSNRHKIFPVHSKQTTSLAVLSIKKHISQSVP